MLAFVQTSDFGVVENICALDWTALSARQLTDAAWAYYHFSIQFRENLMMARRLYPEDVNLEELEAEECNTSNLSPWRDVAAEGERMDHDEFMRRTLTLAPIDAERRRQLCEAGSEYLDAVAAMDEETRALSIVSYEGGGLERVFRSMLTAPDWTGPVLGAFRHFLQAHIGLDEHHGALVRHLDADDRAVPLWNLFRDLLVKCVPALARESAAVRIRDSLGAGAAASCPPVCAATTDACLILGES